MGWWAGRASPSQPQRDSASSYFYQLLVAGGMLVVDAGWTGGNPCSTNRAVQPDRLGLSGEYWRGPPTWAPWADLRLSGQHFSIPSYAPTAIPLRSQPGIRRLTFG